MRQQLRLLKTGTPPVTTSYYHYYWLPLTGHRRLGRKVYFFLAFAARTSGMSAKLTHPDTSQEIYEL